MHRLRFSMKLLLHRLRFSGVSWLGLSYNCMEKKPRVKKEESSSLPEHEKKRARVQYFTARE